MIRSLTIAAGALVMAAMPANAAVIVDFIAGGSPPTPGFSVINTFDNLTGVTTNSGTVKILTGNSSEGAQPAFGSDGSYLSVLGNSSATIDFATAVNAFQFAWGSLDTYNTLTVTDSDNNVYVYTPPILSSGSNGDQGLPGTNGVFTLTGTGGTKFTSIQLSSGSNSFEIDNLAVAVPEPSTWALMILGFGLVGGAMRRRTTALKGAFA